MKNVKSFAVLAASSIVCATVPTEFAYSTTVDFFTNFSDFDQLTTTTLVEDFEAVTPKDTLLSSFVSNDNTYTGLAGSRGGMSFPNVVVASPGYTNFGIPVTTSSILSANGDEDFTIDFGSPTQVVGFDTYLNAFGPATVSVFGSSGLLDTLVLSHDPTEVGFLGIVADEVITSIRWDSVNGRVINTGVDNILQGEIRQSESTPEPSVVLSVCLAGAGSLLLKRKKS